VARKAPVDLELVNGELWVPNNRGDTITRVDAASRAVVETIPVGAQPIVIEAAFGDIWVTHFAGTDIWRIHPSP